jgi:ATP-binding cassette, subfamily B, bacterial CvaB/MchF/RaxB
VIFPDYRYQQTGQGQGTLSCIAMSAHILGADIDLVRLRNTYPQVRGASSQTVIEIARILGLAGRLVRCPLSRLTELASPAMLQWPDGKFVVLGHGCRRGRARIFNPVSGWSWLRTAEIAEHYSGIAIEFTRSHQFVKTKAPRLASPLSLFHFDRHATSGLVKAVLLSVLVQVGVILTPLYLRAVVDGVFPAFDQDLLLLLTLAFVLLATFASLASLLRDLVVRQLSSALIFAANRNVFRHVITLPLTWFQARRLNDVMVSFYSLEQIRVVLGGTLVSACVDGVLSLATLWALLSLSVGAASIAVGFLALSVVVRLLTLPRLKRAMFAAISASIAEENSRMETVRNVQTVKSNRAEDKREAEWLKRLALSIRTSESEDNQKTLLSSAQAWLAGVSSLLVIYLCALAVLASEMTIGGMTAAIAYQLVFYQRAAAFLEQVIIWRTLDVHMARLADPLQTPAEARGRLVTGADSQLKGDFGLREVSFRYGPLEPDIIKSATFDIAAGELVAMIGPSGSGKSTLAKVLCGLYQPTSGVVLLDGQPLESWGRDRLRRDIGTVLQNDELFTATVAENVTLFEDAVDADHLWECLEEAAIAPEIRAMALGENTMVGDTGVSLSGGQRQRLLLARALYRRPSILILDEATSSLDVVRERSILKTLEGKPISRIIIAHRPETIKGAQRVLRLANGALEDVTEEARRSPDLIGVLQDAPVGKA